MSQHNQFSLLKQTRFAPFFWVQFLGAVNDNVFKTALLTIVTYDALHWAISDPGMITNLIPGLFILPFLLFSATSGQLAEKWDKAKLTRWIKFIEILIMGVAALGWMTQHLWLLIAALIGMGLHSTLFGPVKYAYLPLHLKEDELIGGNGLIEMGTFVGILLGEIIGAVLVIHDYWGREFVAITTLVIAVIGWLLSLRIPVSPASSPDLQINWNPLTETIRNIRSMRQNKTVFHAVMANSWFWFYGAVVLAQFPVFTQQVLRGDHSVFVLLLIAFTLGIGVGSLLCEKISRHHIEIGIVPLGAIGLTLFGIDLFIASTLYTQSEIVNALQFMSQRQSWHILLACIGIGIFGGIYIVPLFAVIQTKSQPQYVARMIAGLNIMNALFMVLSAVFAMSLLLLGYSIPELFLITALLNGIVTVWLFRQAPEYKEKFMQWTGLRKKL